MKSVGKIRANEYVNQDTCKSVRQPILSTAAFPVDSAT